MKAILLQFTGSIFLLSAMTACCTPKIEITVKNPLERNRSQEMVTIPSRHLNSLNQGKEKGFILQDRAGKEIAYQITYENDLIFQAEIKGLSEASYTLKTGKPKTYTTYVCGRQYPERVDDMAWENNLCAYRTYGPALQKSGERAFGYDLWTKSTEELVVEKRYAMELDKASRKQISAWRKQGLIKKADSLRRAISYHCDHGNGMDCYKVGPTLGGGTNALLSEGKIIYPYCYKDFEILDNGPLRFTVRLTYHPINCGEDDNIIETRVLSLDKDSYLNKAVVRYDHLKTVQELGIGIVIHPENKEEMGFDRKRGYMYYVDLTDNANADNGEIYIGTVFPSAPAEIRKDWFDSKDIKKRGGASGHLLAVTPYRPQTDYTYYWGNGWSKAGMSYEKWITYLKNFKEQIDFPLITEIKFKK